MSYDPRLNKLQKELNFLYEVAQNVHSLEIDELLREIVDIASKVCRADSCLIYVLDPVRDELVLRSSKKSHPDILRKIKMKMGEGITGWVAKEKKAVAIAKGAAEDPRFKYFKNLPEDRFEAFLSVPIINRKGVCGVINIQHKTVHKHTSVEINLMTAIGKLVGGAVENALLIEESLALKEALELRKTLDKAKGILMKRKKFSEDEAYRVLQKESMDNRRTLKEIADSVILSEKFF
ncbi:GAF and ANTAR domain-containing protein [Candidatus Gottesmanbacteria bacterium]|nr:GAF and ANTAR domain-containing protein [Candidatus Gottesmanbacteria bacterium]